MALILAATAAAVARQWKSSDGNHQIEADLVKVEGGKVTLRKPGGETITVDESKLCEEDRDYLHGGESLRAEKEAPASSKDKESSHDAKPAAKRAHTYPELAAQANRCSSASEALTLFKEFVADKTIADGELLSARNNLPIWQARAAKSMVRIGSQWLDPEQARQLKEKTDGYIAAAIEFVDSRQFDKARAKLAEAARQDANSLEPNFFSGLITVFGHRDIQAAKQEFRECVRRQPDHAPSLNNLALVEVRVQRYDEAIAHWKTALETGGQAEEIYQNIGRLASLARMGVCALPPTSMRKFGELLQILPSDAKVSHNSSVGWLYMPFDATRASKNPWIVPDKLMSGGRSNVRIGEDRLCMICGGAGMVKCPNTVCRGGTVPAGTKDSTQTITPNLPAMGFRSQVRAVCPVCGGRAKVLCPYCVNGIDKTLPQNTQGTPRRGRQVPSY